MLRCNPARGKGNGPVLADVALAPCKVKSASDAAKTADLIPSDDNNGILDLKTKPASKLDAKPIIALPPSKEQDFVDIGGMPALVPSAWADKANNTDSASIKDMMPGVVSKPQKARSGHC